MTSQNGDHSRRQHRRHSRPRSRQEVERSNGPSNDFREGESSRGHRGAPRRKYDRDSAATPPPSESARRTEDRRYALPTPNTSSTIGTPANFATGEDFIAFDFSDQEDEEDEPVKPSSAKGKGREYAEVDARDWKNGTKRSADQMEADDGYANKKQRTDAASRLTPWAEDVEWDSCRNLAEMMHKEVKAFVEYISPRPEEHEMRHMIITMIARVINGAWPDARVSPFGSFETKLYLPLGDIDLVIESRTMEHYEKRHILSKLAQVLRRTNITDNITIISRAKVPIIKFVTSLGRFAVDISLNQGNGIKAGRIVNGFLSELPALQPLVMVIKLFLSQRSMNEVYTGGLGSYAIVCMAASFLQMHPKIRSGEIDPSENLGVLVMEFFELYGHYYNYDNTGISLRDGGTYFSKSARGWVDFRNTSLLSIEDPTDISNDISRNSYNITRVRKTLAGAHEVLATTALMHARVLVSKAQGQYTSLRDPAGRNHEYDNQSILGSVMGVTQETLNHRRLVRQLYEQSTLQNLLGLAPYRPTVRETLVSRSRASVGPSRVSVSRSAKAVESAWGEADMELADSEDELVVPHLPSPEESRYSNRHARKRRKLSPGITRGKRQDAVFVAESDEEDGLVGSHVSRGSPPERKEVVMDARRLEARRAYWASKGMTGGGLEDSD